MGKKSKASNGLRRFDRVSADVSNDHERFRTTPWKRVSPLGHQGFGYLAAPCGLLDRGLVQKCLDITVCGR
jgi:hypothetical protein